VCSSDLSPLLSFFLVCYNPTIMTSKIRVLTEDTINKIAAGEVIENPSSVIKELVENSLDAGATEITIEIKGGGRQLIRISDNGCGMNGDDALLCLERHATSKLKEIDDIHLVGTMGFRGEAIPSIASISKFTLYTRVNSLVEAPQQGTLVIVDGGKIINCSKVECAFGTTIEVKDLFFNVPVRKKFQKSPSYDAAEIQRIVTLLALGNPKIHFQLISNQETLISAPASQKECTFIEALGERVRHLLGNETYESLVPLKGCKSDYILEGFVGSPLSHRHNRSGQHLFINRRGVVVPLVSFGVRDGYGTMLPSGRHPLYVLHLSMPAELMDVNVHPQKREVRLRQERTLKELVLFSVEQALQKGNFPCEASFNPCLERESSGIELPSRPAFVNNPPPWLKHPIEEDNAYTPPYMLPKLELPQEINEVVKTSDPQLFEPPPERLEKPIKQLKALGTMQKYILATDMEGAKMYCIDQRASHARVIYEQLLNCNSQQPQELQMLLIPHLLNLPPSESALLRQQLSLLQDAGIQIKEFGPTSFVIDALPLVFGNVDIHKLIDEIVKSSYDGVDCSAIAKEQKRKLALAASRSAIAAQARLTLPEAQELLDQLAQCAQPNQCPYGKMTLVTLTLSDIGKFFQ
jgi:DNA mismatch repair protein MutL